jgi:hypothetical protein
MADNSQHIPLPNPSSDDSGPPPEQSLTSARIEMLLANGKIAEMRGIMRWGSNYAALVTITDGELETTAVYKPQRGERPLWDFPDGTLCYRETAAYVISEALGWRLVPPTVLRSGPHGLGSVQQFVEHNPEINYFSLDDRFLEQLQRYTIFDYLINNADRKGGHLLLDATGKIWGIDHGLSFNTVSKLRTVIWEFAGQTIQPTLLTPVEKLLTQIDTPKSTLHGKLGGLLSTSEINALRRRTEQLLICKEYPQPGPGPNYPWPPV